jgi:hypothetical protein
MPTVDIRQLYDSDPRPTFIVDCADTSGTIYHVNPALLRVPQLASSLHTYDTLRDWWDPASRAASCHQAQFRHGRYQWTKFTVCQRWLVVTLVDLSPCTDEMNIRLQKSAQAIQITPPVQSQSDTIFTVKIQSPELQEHVQRLRMVDWAATSLGPISGWNYELNLLITTLMLETRPTALFLGPDHVIVYNLAYAAVSGSRHPRILGKSIIDAWCVTGMLCYVCARS